MVDDIAVELCAYIAAQHGKHVTAQTNLREIGLDSMQLLDAVFHAERLMGGSLSGEQLMQAHTVQDIVQLLGGERNE